jgi:two-component system OmpR family response regulator
MNMMVPLKTLLISADDSLTRSIATCLTQAGFTVIHSPRGSESLELIRTENPTLVILDIDLPDYNSLAIIRGLRAEEINSRIPVILIGASLSEENVLLGLEVGADLCLLETFHPQVFIARVRSLLRRGQMVKIV